MISRTPARREGTSPLILHVPRGVCTRRLSQTEYSAIHMRVRSKQPKPKDWFHSPFRADIFTFPRVMQSAELPLW
ncbi:hypothetical protein NDU88_012601 [Pleurodeles waltl]|uniref:Uncharacterized protein n=1 Tax=Pleurodeles waltl TaxID=8319 RepID=A0AAV7R0I9_PLEWA|nr:hypothetical protein NDU88_012601 [Pleurodeles waltl]